MTIGIDARLVAYRRGIGNFVVHLLSEVASMATPHRYVLYVDDPASVPLLPAAPEFSPRVLGPKLYPLWEQVRLAVAARADRLDVLYCPANSAPLVRPRRTRLVLTVHDVMFMLPAAIVPPSPSLYQRAGRAYLRSVVPAAIRGAAAVTTVSAYSAGDIAAHCGVPAERITVIGEAVGPGFVPAGDAAVLDAVRRTHGLAPRFVLAFGALDPRKNTACVIQAYARFRDRHPDYQLLVVGLSAAAQRRFQDVASAAGAAGGVVFAGFVSEADLVALYSAAEMLVYPSLYEGFGVPVLEAMACGTPVVASGAASLPEIAGDAAVFVDPSSPGGIAEAMCRVAEDASLRADMIRRGHERARTFTWRATAVRWLAACERVMERPA